MEERWKVIPEYPWYRISTLGNVESCISGAWKSVKTRKIYKGKRKPHQYYIGFDISTNEGTRYDKNGISKGTLRKTTFVHVLVARVFIGPRPPGLFVCHLDDNPDNNEWANVVYGTQAENQ